MHHKYDLFEKFPDGSSLWRACVLGLEATNHHLREFAQKSEHQFYAIDIESGKTLYSRLTQAGMHLSAHRKIGRRGTAAIA